MGSDQPIDHLWRDAAAGNVAGQLIAGQLFLHKAVERLVLIERADDVIAVAPGERPVAIGAEVAIRVRVAGGVQPVLPPALPIVRRRQVALDQPVVGVGR